MIFKNLGFGLIGLTSLFACNRPIAHQTAVVSIAADSALRVVSGARALDNFKPAREPVLDDGECVSSELRATGVRHFVAHFPNRKEPETAIVVFVDSSGKMVRYVENRGVPRPGKSMEEMQTQMRALVRTYIQVDYVTDEAMVSNRGPNQSPVGVRATVAQVENTKSLGDLRSRAALVRRLCEGYMPRPPR
jgi:hypothetical protein